MWIRNRRIFRNKTSTAGEVVEIIKAHYRDSKMAGLGGMESTDRVGCFSVDFE
jgi:hypothetical protein